jgi:hypothetical protein
MLLLLLMASIQLASQYGVTRPAFRRSRKQKS